MTAQLLQPSTPPQHSLKTLLRKSHVEKTHEERQPPMSQHSGLAFDKFSKKLFST
jgi:hypothetical protein